MHLTQEKHIGNIFYNINVSCHHHPPKCKALFITVEDRFVSLHIGYNNTRTHSKHKQSTEHPKIISFDQYLNHLNHLNHHIVHLSTKTKLCGPLFNKIMSSILHPKQNYTYSLKKQIKLSTQRNKVSKSSS